MIFVPRIPVQEVRSPPPTRQTDPTGKSSGQVREYLNRVVKGNRGPRGESATAVKQEAERLYPPSRIAH
jgi:hypothetical protein